MGKNEVHSCARRVMSFPWVAAVALPVLWAGTLEAQVTVTGGLSASTVALGEGALLEIRVSGVQAAGLPAVPKSDDLAFTRWSQSARFEMGGGRSVQRVTFTCQVYPRKMGRLRLAGITVQAGGRTHTLDPIALVVTESEITATAELSPRKLAVDETAELTVRLFGGQPDGSPALPETEGLNFSQWSHEPKAESHQGRIRRIDTFTCKVSGSKPGEYVLRGISVRSGGQTYPVEAPTLEVIEDYEPTRVLAVLHFSKSEVYLSEPVLLTFDLLDKGLERVDFQLPWYPPKGFLVLDPVPHETHRSVFAQPDNEQTITINQGKNPQQIVFSIGKGLHDGQDYRRFRFQRLLTPVAPGEHTFGPSVIHCTVLEGHDRVQRRTRWGLRTMEVPKRRNLVVRAEPTKLVVKAPPDEGKPGDYSGAVGEFELHAAAGPTEVKVGEPVTVTIEVKGSGNFQSVGQPSLESTEGLRLYDSETEEEVEPKGTSFHGVKRFTVPVIPTDDSIKEIPAVRFSFFDPQQKAYRTLTRGPFPITVLPEERDLSAVSVTSPVPGQRKLKVRPVAGIFPLRRPALDEFRNHAEPFYEKPLWLAMLPLPALLCVVCFLVERRLSRVGSDAALQRSLKASSAAAGRLNAARAAEGVEFHQAIADALTGFLADKCDLPPASVDAASAPPLLADRGVAGDLVDGLVSQLEACDVARFGGDASATDREAVLAKSKDLIASLNKSLR